MTSFVYRQTPNGDTVIIGSTNEDNETVLLTPDCANNLRDMGLKVAARFPPTTADYIVYGSKDNIAKIIPIPETSWFYDEDGIIVKIKDQDDYCELKIVSIPYRCPYIFTTGTFQGFQCWKTGFGDHIHTSDSQSSTLITNKDYIQSSVSACGEIKSILNVCTDHLTSVRQIIIQSCLDQMATQTPILVDGSQLRFIYIKPVTCPLDYSHILPILTSYFRTHETENQTTKTTIIVNHDNSPQLSITVKVTPKDEFQQVLQNYCCYTVGIGYSNGINCC